MSFNIEAEIKKHEAYVADLRNQAAKLSKLTGTPLNPLSGLDAYLKENIGRPTVDRSKDAYGQCLDGLEELFAREDDQAIWELARVAERAAYLLEVWWRKSPDQVRATAEQMTDWPVNLSLDGAKRLRRKKVAADYIKALNVNHNPCVDDLKRSRRANDSPYQLAARVLYDSMRRLQAGGVKPKRTAWLKKLQKLEPLTADNVDDWWPLAREWLQAVWKAEWPILTTFEPLTGKAKYNPKTTNSSDIERDVIDHRFKQAFKALAEG